MKSSAGKAGRKRRWWRRVVVAAFLLPLFLFGLSNLWLATPPGLPRLTRSKTCAVKPVI